MDLEVEEMDALKRKLKIKIPADVMAQRIDAAYRELNGQIRMPGFRPGKIPQHILEKQVPVQAFTRMYQELMQDYYEKALLETKITPAGTPEINHDEVNEVKKGEPFCFSITLDIKPDFELKPYKGIKMQKKEPVITDADINELLQKICEAHGRLEPVAADCGIEKGHVVAISFDGFLRDAPLENASAKNFKLRIGDKKLIPGFEEQLAGHKAGEEFELNVQLPSDWNKKLRRVAIPVPGAQDEARDIALFKVNVHSVEKLIPAELDDALAKTEGADTVDELRRKLRINQQSHKERRAELHLKEDLFQKIVDMHSFTPPESLVKNEIRFMVEGAKFQIEQSGMKVEDSGFDEEQARSEWWDKAEKNTKGYMILDAIADKEKIHVTESDMEQEYKRLAAQVDEKPEVIKKRLLSSPESFNQAKSKLRGQKTMNFLYANCELEYIKDGK